MKGLYEIREKLCEVEEEILRKGEFSPGSVGLTDTILNAIKNTYKIEMYQNQLGGGYSKGGSYDSYGMDSYRRGYSRDSGSYGGGYAERGSYGSGGSYGKEKDMKHKLREMMERAPSEEKEFYRRIMMELDE